MGELRHNALGRESRARSALRVTRVGGIGVVAVVAIGIVAAIAVPSRSASLPVAPDFSVPALTPGRPVITSAATAGHVTVLTFWASWCEPCRQELPGMVGALAGTPSSPEVIGIDTNDQRGEALRFLQTLHLDLRSGFDDRAAVATAFRLPGLPATVILSSSGRVAARYLGPAPVGALRAQAARAAHQR